MNGYSLVSVIVLLTLACGPTVDPTLTPDIGATVRAGTVQTRAAVPTPTPNIEATIQAGIQQTKAAVPTPTPNIEATIQAGPTPTLTPTSQPTATPRPTPTLTPTPRPTPTLTPTSTSRLRPRDVPPRTPTARPAFTLTVNCKGLGAVGPQGCSTTRFYGQGTAVSLAASPGRDWQFVGWSGCDAVSGTKCTVTMNSDQSVRANFRAPVRPPGR